MFHRTYFNLGREQHCARCHVLKRARVEGDATLLVAPLEGLWIRQDEHGTPHP